MVTNANSNNLPMTNIDQLMTLMTDLLDFAEWTSDKAYKKCINGEWIQTGTGDYRVIAKNTSYNLFKESNDYNIVNSKDKSDDNSTEK